MNKNSIRDSVEKYVEFNSKSVKDFWHTGNTDNLPSINLQDHCDYIYIQALLGFHVPFSKKAVEHFADVVRLAPLAGKRDCDTTLLPHLSAYLLASLNVLAQCGHDVRANVYKDIYLDIHKLVDKQTFLPVWPKIWSHHTWRVSHWIGGIPSILLSFSNYDPKKLIDESLVTDILEACDEELIDKKSGLLKAYKSEFIQAIFRQVYKIRHNPEHGDIGGLVHIHWINHVLGREYIAKEALFERCIKHLGADGFLESKPYCLDFDYIQLIRTIIEQRPQLYTKSVSERILGYKNDLVSFLTELPKEGYSLHKIPGALATLHECCLILGHSTEELGTEPVDIIKMGYWL